MAMPPPPPRKRPKTILEEEEYLSRMEEIIERDFFPDIPTLRSQLQGFQDRESRRTTGEAVLGNVAGTPASLSGHGHQQREGPLLVDTPIVDARNPQGLLETPVVVCGEGLMEGSEQSSEASCRGRSKDEGKDVSLDEFLSNHTSEDNASFQVLQQEFLQRKRQKNEHYLEDKNVDLLEGPRTETDGYGTTGQEPSTLKLWKHVPKNRLFYDSSQTKCAQLTSLETSQLVQGAPKTIMHCNTRFSLPEGVSKVHEDEPVKRQQQGEEYNYVATPVPVAGVNMSPIMTWGELGSTPIRLDGCSTPEFKIRELSQRDKMGKALATSARKSLAKRNVSKDLSGCRSGTPRSISAAGMKLASSLRAKTPGTDMELRASYSGTPYKHVKSIRQNQTPVRVESKQPVKVEEVQVQHGHITDGLLDV